jgi:hypothetical protein
MPFNDFFCDGNMKNETKIRILQLHELYIVLFLCLFVSH